MKKQNKNNILNVQVARIIEIKPNTFNKYKKAWKCIIVRIKDNSYFSVLIKNKEVNEIIHKYNGRTINLYNVIENEQLDETNKDYILGRNGKIEQVLNAYDILYFGSNNIHKITKEEKEQVLKEINEDEDLLYYIYSRIVKGSRNESQFIQLLFDIGSKPPKSIIYEAANNSLNHKHIVDYYISNNKKIPEKMLIKMAFYSFESVKYLIEKKIPLSDKVIIKSLNHSIWDINTFIDAGIEISPKVKYNVLNRTYGKANIDEMKEILQYKI
jgi:hypothetical protein